MHIANVDWEVRDWVIDSGATFHCCKDRAAFTEYRKVNHRVQIANGQHVRVYGIGTVGSLRNVNHIPDFTVNLLISDGYTITFLPDKTVVMTYERNDSQQIGAFDDVMYLLGHNMSKSEKEVQSVSSSGSSQQAIATLISEEKTKYALRIRRRNDFNQNRRIK